jgi:hypothetical protein
VPTEGALPADTAVQPRQHAHITGHRAAPDRTDQGLIDRRVNTAGQGNGLSCAADGKSTLAAPEIESAQRPGGQ